VFLKERPGTIAFNFAFYGRLPSGLFCSLSDAIYICSKDYSCLNLLFKGRMLCQTWQEAAPDLKNYEINKCYRKKQLFSANLFHTFSKYSTHVF
jgi:hypothetical protein